MAEWSRTWEKEGLGATGQRAWDVRVHDGPFNEQFTVRAATEEGAVCLAQEATQRPNCRIHFIEQGGQGAD